MQDRTEMQAKEVYELIASTLTARQWNFDREDENLIIRSGVGNNDGMAVHFILRVNPRNRVIQFLSSLPFKMPEDMRVDGAVAVAVANYGIVDGSFDYDVTDGEIRYRLTNAYLDSTLDPELFEYMIGVSVSTINQYSDRFYMLSRKMITLEKFIEMEKGE